MNEENRQPVSDFPAVAARHALQFLGNVFEIETLDIPAPRAPCLILQPGDEIVFIGGRIPWSCHRLIPVITAQPRRFQCSQSGSSTSSPPEGKCSRAALTERRMWFTAFR